MNKRRVIEEIQSYLAEELRDLSSGAAFEGTEEQRGERMREIRDLLVMYKFLPVREYGEGDVVCPAGLVELDLNGTRAFYFVVPKGGGLIANVDGRPVQVITPNSPLGDVLLGRQVGDEVVVPGAGGKSRTYRIVSYV